MRGGTHRRYALVAVAVRGGEGEFASPAPARRARLVLDGELATLPGLSLAIPVDFESCGNLINSVAFSLAIDPSRLRLDPRDDDGDGVPDAVHFPPASLPPLATVVVDYGDCDGEIDLLLADLTDILTYGRLFEL